MPPVTTGKSGTLSPTDFEKLNTMAAASGAKLLATKVAKICLTKSAALKHEYALSSVGAAYGTIGSKLTSVVGTGTKAISREAFNSLTSMVGTYGPELVIQKLAKIAKRNGVVAEATMLKSIFPKAA